MKNHRRSLASSTPADIGKIFFNTPTQVAIYRDELQGQFSDGMWENSNPREHWVFWCRLTPTLDPVGVPRVETGSGYLCLKERYGLTKLMSNDDCLHHMLNIGRMARALASLKTEPAPDRWTAEYMPETLDDWRALKASGKWEHGFIREYMDTVSDALAVAYYSSSYTSKELRSDLKVIAEAMKNRVAIPS